MIEFFQHPIFPAAGTGIGSGRSEAAEDKVSFSCSHFFSCLQMMVVTVTQPRVRRMMMMLRTVMMTSDQREARGELWAETVDKINIII